MSKKITLGISSCLLGKSVRYDAKHKLDHCLKDAFGKSVKWISVCPEVECGLGVPREPMHLIGKPGSLRLVTRNSNIDHTDKMLKWSEKKLKELGKKNISGFIFKSNSPSCGLHKVFHKKGTGIFAMEVIKRFHALPVEDEENLRDEGVRKNFIEKISAFKPTS